MNGLFVTATDTGVGKTWVACALARAAVRRGLRVAIMKPCETGDGDDGARLLDAAGRALDPALARPYRFALPASPEVAARAEGAVVDVARIAESFARLTRDADFTIVEGAGGLLVPVASGVLMADVAGRLGLPLLVVARASLGTVNHTLLTLEAARARSLAVAGVVLCRAVESAGPEEATNPDAIARWGRVPILGTFPHGRDADAVADRVLDQIQPRAR
ncbi:MAG TPA: dethiobiotin synthase [Polyangia bacterium]